MSDNNEENKNTISVLRLEIPRWLVVLVVLVVIGLLVYYGYCHYSGSQTPGSQSTGGFMQMGGKSANFLDNAVINSVDSILRN